MNFIARLRSIWNQSNTHEDSNNENSTEQSNFYQQRSVEEQQRANAISETANTISEKSNSIANISLIISGIAMAATIAVFLQTKDAVEASQDSAKYAKDANDETRTEYIENKRRQDQQDYNDSTRQHNKDSTDSVDRKNNLANIERSFAFNQKSIEQQIQTLNETKDEFDKQHRAFIDIDNMKIVNFNPYDSIELDFSLRNIGEQPVLTDSASFTMLFSDAITGIKEDTIQATFNILKEYFTKSIFYVDKNAPSQQTQHFKGLGKSEFDAIKKANLLMYICGEIIYKNLITGKRGVYDFYVVLKPSVMYPKFQDTYSFYRNINY